MPRRRVRGRILEARVYENERWLPVSGWGGRLLPTDRFRWTNAEGKRATFDPLADKLGDPLWVGGAESEWEIEVDCVLVHGKWEVETDWEYAFDFPAPFRRYKRPPSFRELRCVRRRLWRRRCKESRPAPRRPLPKSSPRSALLTCSHSLPCRHRLH